MNIQAVLPVFKASWYENRQTKVPTIERERKEKPREEKFHKGKYLPEPGKGTVIDFLA